MTSIERLASAVRGLADGISADHAMLQRSDEKYRGVGQGSSLAADLVRKVGLQVMLGYRVMHFLSEVEADFAAQIASRLVRHLYGSDVHYDAAIAPGVLVVHGMGMAISPNARIEKNVILFQHCTLGEGRHPDTSEVGAPTVEEGAVIGVGAVILGPVTIGKRSKIMPGCIVLRSVPPDSVVEPAPPAVRPRASGAPQTVGVVNGT